MRGRSKLVIGIACLLLGGCVNEKRFRFVHNQPECFGGGSDPFPGRQDEQTLPYASIDCRTTLYKTGFIEFNEDGSYVDQVQEQKVLALIAAEKRRAPGGKVITFVYVHGWKNNGEQAPPGGPAKDVERFSTALGELGYRAHQASPDQPVPVIGVYIGWRGKSVSGPSWFTFVSLWGRRNTANRIGSGHTLTTALNAIIEGTNAGSTRSRVILVGHSFGARVLEHAIESGVQLYDVETVKRSTVVTPRVDLVLYVNSANDARLSLARVEQLQKDPIVVRHPDYDPAKCATGHTDDLTCREYPLLVAITSTGDLATKYLLPIATTLAPDGRSAPTPPRPPDGFIDRTPLSAAFQRHAAAHMTFMQSHAVTEVDCPVDPNQRLDCDKDDPTCAFKFRTFGDCAACFKASVRSAVNAKRPFNQTAFWIMNIDTRISKDHGDIWNLSLLNMLGELISPRGFFEPAVGRMQVRLDTRVNR